MGLAFGVQSGLGPQAGIFTAIILAFVAALFGGTRTLITDPTGPMTVVAATVVSMGLARAGELAGALPLIIGTFVLAGVFETIFGVLNFGKYVKLMPYPVVSGFMAGIGVIIISVQLFPILGYASPRGVTNIISNLGEPVANINYDALGLAALTVAVIYLLPLVTKRIPGILAALIIGTLTSVTLGCDVPVIGAIPTALPAFQLHTLSALEWSDLSYMIRPAIMLGGLGVIDSLLTSVVADNLTRTRHDSRRTVIGQGVGNIITALFGGIPGAGATMGTVTNIRAGAQTPLSGLLKGVFLLLIVVGVADYVEYIPMPVLAAILLTIGVGIIDYKGIRMLLRVPRQDALVWAVVLSVTVFDNLLDAVGIGFTLSAILFTVRVAKDTTSRQKSQTLKEVIETNILPKNLTDHIAVLNLDGPLFFGFADPFRKHCEEVTNVMAVIIRMDKVPFLDQSGLVTIESVITDWHARGIQVYLAGANNKVSASLAKVGILPDCIRPGHCFDRFEDCVKSISNKISGRSGEAEFEEVLLEKHVKKNRHRRAAEAQIAY